MFVPSSENCLNGPKINTFCQLVTLKSAGPLNQQTFTASCVFSMPWAEKQLFVFPVFFPSFYLLSCCAVVKALLLHLYKLFLCPNVAALLDSDGWAAVVDRLEHTFCCRQEGILNARQKCGSCRCAPLWYEFVPELKRKVCRSTIYIQDPLLGSGRWIRWATSLQVLPQSVVQYHVYECIICDLGFLMV